MMKRKSLDRINNVQTVDTNNLPTVLVVCITFEQYQLRTNICMNITVFNIRNQPIHIYGHKIEFLNEKK